jgi:hypothetical protein
MMDEVQKPSNSECHTPSSEPFRIYDIEMFNIRIIVFILHYMFRSAKIITRWFTNTYVLTELSIKMDPLFTFTNNIYNLNFKF